MLRLPGGDLRRCRGPRQRLVRLFLDQQHGEVVGGRRGLRIGGEGGPQGFGSFVRADEKMIQDYYGSRGYADARVETSILDAGPGLVTVAYNISEGTKSYISKVNISGNSITEDEVIRREMPFAPGEELNTVKIAAGKSRLENLNYFSAVDVRNTPSLVDMTWSRMVRLMVKRRLAWLPAGGVLRSRLSVGVN